MLVYTDMDKNSSSVVFLPNEQTKNDIINERTDGYIKNNGFDEFETEFEQPATRWGRVTRALGTLSARANVRLMSIGSEDSFMNRAVRPITDSGEKLSQRFEQSDEDSRVARIKKFIGRNAIELGMGVTAAAGYSALFYMRTKGVEWDLRMIGGVPTRDLEVKNLAVETNFWIGGRMDGTGDMYVDQAQAGGQYDYNANNIQANYSASIGPLDGERMDASTNVAAMQAAYAYNSAGGVNAAPYEIHAFSEGTVAGVQALNQIAAENGGVVPDNVTLIIDGSPVGAMGLYNSPYPGAISPILGAMGIDTNVSIPPGANVIVRSYQSDIWGNGGNQSALTSLGMAGGLMGDAHKPIDNSAILIGSRVIDGVTYEEYAYGDGPQNALLRGAYAQGLYVSPAADNFMNALMPITHVGEPTRYANASEVGYSAGALIDDTIAQNTGIDSTYAQQAVGAIMTPERTGDLQTMLDAGNILPERFANMANNPASIPTELPAAMNQINDVIDTVTKYIPSETNHPLQGIINDGLRGAGVQYQLPPPPPMNTVPVPTHVPAAPVFEMPAPAPVYHAPAPAPVYHPPVPVHEAPVVTPSPPTPPAVHRENPVAPVIDLFKNNGGNSPTPVKDLISGLLRPAA